MKHLARLSTNESLIKCLKALWEESGGGKLCPKVLEERRAAAAAAAAGRGKAVRAGVQGFFTPDGVVCGHVFVAGAESMASIVMDGLRHLQVSCYTYVQEYVDIYQVYRFMFAGRRAFAGRYPFRSLGCIDFFFATAGRPFIFFGCAKRHRISPLHQYSHVQMHPKGKTLYLVLYDTSTHISVVGLVYIYIYILVWLCSVCVLFFPQDSAAASSHILETCFTPSVRQIVVFIVYSSSSSAVMRVRAGSGL